MKFLIGLIVGLLILPVAITLYALSGRMPVATSDSPMPFEGLLAGGGLNSRIRREAPTREVSSFGTFELVSGADIYQKNCAVCHGLPGQTLGPVAQGEFPRPPQLFTPDGRVTDDPPGVTYWKVKNGIRLTGMPGFHATLTDMQMWQVTALVARADKLPPEAMEALKPAPPVILISAGAANPAAAKSDSAH
jgi:hypothetical protein